MLQNPADKYRPMPHPALDDRRWPSAVIRKPPVWCSVDLRDGNQALVEPMNSARKSRMFDTLVAVGFREIEIGFPSASQTDFDFCRELIEQNRIPADVTVQVLVQARDEFIERTFQALQGVHRAIVHVYNSTSELQRRVVFGLDKQGIKEIALNGALQVKHYAAKYPQTHWAFQYSPESFTGTEWDYALEVCEAVMDVWHPTGTAPVILNLPATVEMTTPNLYADQIEWFCRNVKQRDSVIVSLHPHNDRGTAVAAAELGLMAGADRVEGTLFGNGERTGNVDIVTLALNMYTQGVHPGLRFDDINSIIECAEFCNQLPVHPRHPYAGELVFTAFSGSHQDAIKKGLAAQKTGGAWEVPYLPLDPADLGRSYMPIIRVNSQSGKAGVAFLLERDYGIKLPRGLQIDLSRAVQKISDATGREVTSREIWEEFKDEYVNLSSPFALFRHHEDSTGNRGSMEAAVGDDGVQHTISGSGNGPIDAFVRAFTREFQIPIRVVSYEEHALRTGADATAVAFVELEAGGGRPEFGVGMHPNIISASLNAIISSVNRSVNRQGRQIGSRPAAASLP